MSPPEKLLVASAVVGKQNVKSDAAFAAIKSLASWRNAFAHGHCTDRPTKSLRHNHLIQPGQYPGIPDTLINMQNLVSGFIKVNKFLASISINLYTAGSSVEIVEVEKLLKDISCFKFTISDSGNDVYEIEHN